MTEEQKNRLHELRYIKDLTEAEDLELDELSLLERQMFIDEGVIPNEN